MADADRLDEVGPLFRGMVEHHRAVTGDQWPVRDAKQAWQRRRRQYTAWLADGRSWLLLAEAAAWPRGPARARPGPPAPGGATWSPGGSPSGPAAGASAPC